MKKTIRVAGYVKLAKLWERNKDDAISLHRAYFEERCSVEEGYRLVDVFIDITGNKHMYKRAQMVALLKACINHKIDLIITPSRAYLAPNSQEFCYFLKFLFDLPHRIEIISDDDDYKIDTILNIENQRESLYGMAEKFYKLSPGEYEEWKSKLLEAIDKIQEESQRG